MKTYKFLVIAALIAHGLITACSSTSGGSVVDKPGYNDRKQAFTENDLANAIYRINELGAFKLDNGEFKRQYGEGMTQMYQITLEKVAFGDLDHDGLSDAAVILAWQSGGSGTFRYLVAMRNTGNAPRQQDSVLLGDRVHISALSIAAGQVSLETVAAGPHDPACCPSQQVKQAYVLRDGKWRKVPIRSLIQMRQPFRTRILPALSGNGNVLRTCRIRMISILTIPTNTR